MPRFWDGPGRLGHWVSAQRHDRKSGDLSPERIRRLEALSFTWSTFANVWQRRLAQIDAFKSKHGHVRVRADAGHLALIQRSR